VRRAGDAPRPGAARRAGPAGALSGGGEEAGGRDAAAPAQVELHEEEDGSIREGARLASPARALVLEAKAGRRGSRGNASWKKRRRTPVFKKMSRPWEWWEQAGLLLGCWFAAAAAAGPEYVDASLAALECAWWLARVLVHRALGTALLFAIVVLHLVSHYRVLLVRSYVLIWWRLECDADDLELDCTWTQTLETALRRSRRFWRAGHYYSALRSLERVYESVRSTWPQVPYVRLDCTLTNVRLRHPKNAGETEATRRAGHAATAKVGLLTVLNRHFESEDAPMATAHAAYIRKNQESFAEAMHREQHECEEHVRHQAEKFEEATQKPWLYIALQVELRGALAHVVIYNLQRQYTNVNRILEVIWEDWEEWVDDLTGGRYDVWERKCVLSKFVIKDGDVKIFYAKSKHDAEQLDASRGRVGRKMKRIQKMLLRGGKGRDLIPSISILNEEIICERKRAQFLWLNQIVFRTLLNSSFDNVTNLISGVTDSIDALTHALTHPFHRRDGSVRSKKGAAVAGLAMDPAYLAVHGALNGVKEVSQGITDGGKAIANGFMSGNIISAKRRGSHDHVESQQHSLLSGVALATQSVVDGTKRGVTSSVSGVVDGVASVCDGLESGATSGGAHFGVVGRSLGGVVGGVLGGAKAVVVGTGDAANHLVRGVFETASALGSATSDGIDRARHEGAGAGAAAFGRGLGTAAATLGGGIADATVSLGKGVGDATLQVGGGVARCVPGHDKLARAAERHVAAARERAESFGDRSRAALGGLRDDGLKIGERSLSRTREAVAGATRGARRRGERAMDRARSAGSKSSRTRFAAPNSTRLHCARMRPFRREACRRASSTRREPSRRPNIGRIDVDATESERSEVSERPPEPAVDVGAGGARASTASASGSRATGAAGPCGRPRPRRRRTRPSSGPSCPSSTSRPGQHKRATCPTSKAPISAVFHSFRLILGRAIVSRNGLEAWMPFLERASAEHSRLSDVESPLCCPGRGDARPRRAGPAVPPAQVQPAHGRRRPPGARRRAAGPRGRRRRRRPRRRELRADGGPPAVRVRRVVRGRRAGAGGAGAGAGRGRGVPRGELRRRRRAAAVAGRVAGLRRAAPVRQLQPHLPERPVDHVGRNAPVFRRAAAPAGRPRPRAAAPSAPRGAGRAVPATSRPRRRPPRSPWAPRRGRGRGPARGPGPRARGA